jgi:probable phosphoglycerate mutase
VLWRHGRTEWNDVQRFQGQMDIALDEIGRAQASEAAQRLARLDPDVIVASDLSRAAQTAQALADRTGLAVRLEAALRESSGGTWEGRLAADLRSDPSYVAWLAGEDVPAGGSETRSQVADRAVAVVRQVAAGLEPGGLAVVTSHGGAIRSIIGRMMGLPVEHWRSFGVLANCCWSVLEESRDAWRLVEHNAGSLPERVIGDDR